jgi:amino acid adenylation domain-containing protein
VSDLSTLPLQGIFEFHAQLHPGAPAITYLGRTLSFAELERMANRLARVLIAHGAGPDVPIAIMMPRSIEIVAAILAVLKAGSFYIPLDLSWPEGRLSQVEAEASSGTLAIVGDSGAAGAIFPRRLAFADLERAAAGQDEGPLKLRSGPENLAYAIFTSGSTGRPKGVLIEHRAIANLALGRQTSIYSRANRGQLRSTLSSSFAFDGSVGRLCAMMTGNHLFPVPEDARVDPLLYLDFLEENRIDLFDSSPSHIRTLIEAGFLERNLPGLAFGFVGGEDIEAALWDHLAAHPATFFNSYGPTETAVAVSHAIISADRAPSIGTPLPNVEILLRDDDLNPVARDGTGEIVIRGRCLARGYWNMPDLTNEKFPARPASDGTLDRFYRTGDLGRYNSLGEIVYLGRKDREVKVRGFRVNLAEIENALMALGASQAAVVVRDDIVPGASTLIAYVAPLDADLQALEQAIKQAMPNYMTPAVYSLHDALPRTSSGKVDYRALPIPDRSARRRPAWADCKSFGETS